MQRLSAPRCPAGHRSQAPQPLRRPGSRQARTSRQQARRSLAGAEAFCAIRSYLATATRVTLPEPPGPGVPVQLRVEIAGSVRGAGITAGPLPPPRRTRRTFWQWLRRAPRPPAIAA
jgi:hypothetical protein